MAKKKRLSVGAEGHYVSGSEVIRTDIDLSKQGEHYIVVEHLSSQKCVVIDLVYPNGARLRCENLYYDEA